MGVKKGFSESYKSSIVEINARKIFPAMGCGQNCTFKVESSNFDNIRPNFVVFRENPS